MATILQLLVSQGAVVLAWNRGYVVAFLRVEEVLAKVATTIK